MHIGAAVPAQVMAQVKASVGGGDYNADGRKRISSLEGTHQRPETLSRAGAQRLQKEARLSGLCRHYCVPSVDTRFDRRK